MPTERSLLFVYGTLKRGGANHEHIADQTFVATAETLPGYVLYELDGYPGMIRDHGTAERVAGELWEVDEHALARLDAFEGVPDGLYRRERIQLAPPHQAAAAETYLYAQSTVHRKRLGAQWPV